ncbi:hypothetical protein ACFL18_01785 [Patescibacteria group bacterium]
MKLPKEYTMVIIIGLFLLAYLLDVLVDPLQINLVTPYHYLQPQHLTRYPFTTASILIKSIALFITPLWILSFFSKHFYAKGGTLLVLASLMQLYAIQEIATNTQIIPLEWSLSLSIGGAALLLPSILFILTGAAQSMKEKITNTPKDLWQEEGKE